MRLAVRETAPHRCADAGRDVGIERVHVQAHVDEPGASDVPERLPDHSLEAEPVDVAHRVDRDVELREQAGLRGVE